MSPSISLLELSLRAPTSRGLQAVLFVADLATRRDASRAGSITSEGPRTRTGRTGIRLGRAAKLPASPFAALQPVGKT